MVHAIISLNRRLKETWLNFSARSARSTDGFRLLVGVRQIKLAYKVVKSSETRVAE